MSDGTITFDPEKADFYVCMPVGPTVFTDNERGLCSDCGREIMFRPGSPAGVPKICIDCVMDREAGGRA